MDLWTLVRILVRRWMVVVPGIVLTVAAAVLLVVGMGPAYEALGHFVIVPARSAGVPGTDEASGPPPLQHMAHVLSEVVRSAPVQQRLRDGGATGAYDVDIDQDGPLMRLSAVGDSPDETSLTLRLLVEAITQEAETRFGADDRVHAEVLVAPSEPTPRTAAEGGGYLSSSSMLLSATGPAQGTPVNPFGQLGFSITSVIVDIAGSSSFGERLQAADATSAFELFPDNQAPIVRVIATDAAPDRAERTIQVLLDVLNEGLVERQELTGASPGSWIALESLGPPDAKLVGGRKLRPLLAMLALGGSLTVGAAVLAEALGSRTRKRDDDDPESTDLESGIKTNETDPRNDPELLRFP